MLRGGGFESTTVASAERALELLHNHHDFSLVVIDLALPEMDGFALMEHIRNTPELRHLRLVAITAYHTPELKFKAIDRGFDGYFAKPIDTNSFLHAIENSFA
jgi:CheY-like chemotaxis protein